MSSENSYKLLIVFLLIFIILITSVTIISFNKPNNKITITQDSESSPEFMHNGQWWEIVKNGYHGEK